VTWSRDDWLARSLLFAGMWSVAVGAAGVVAPDGVPVPGPTALAVGLSVGVTAAGLLAVGGGFVVFERRVEPGGLALSADAVAERWDQH
jgi:hypothetical protein